MIAFCSSTNKYSNLINKLVELKDTNIDTGILKTYALKEEKICNDQFTTIADSCNEGKKTSQKFADNLQKYIEKLGNQVLKTQGKIDELKGTCQVDKKQLEEETKNLQNIKSELADENEQFLTSVKESDEKHTIIVQLLNIIYDELAAGSQENHGLSPPAFLQVKNRLVSSIEKLANIMRKSSIDSSTGPLVETLILLTGPLKTPDTYVNSELLEKLISKLKEIQTNLHKASEDRKEAHKKALANFQAEKENSLKAVRLMKEAAIACRADLNAHKDRLRSLEAASGRANAMAKRKKLEATQWEKTCDLSGPKAACLKAAKELSDAIDALQ